MRDRENRVEVAAPVKLDLRKKLEDQDYRKKFFWAETSAWIAKQLVKLRKRRGLNQADLAQLVGTGQPAISRVERADYGNWNFRTLRKLAEVMDARIRVIIEPAEDVLKEYETAPDAKSAHVALFTFTGSTRTEVTSTHLRDLVSRIGNIAIYDSDQYRAPMAVHRTQSPAKAETEVSASWIATDPCATAQSGFALGYSTDPIAAATDQLSPRYYQPSQATPHVVH